MVSEVLISGVHYFALSLSQIEGQYAETTNEETRNSEFESNSFLNVEGGFP